MTVSEMDRAAMARLLKIMNGEAVHEPDPSHMMITEHDHHVDSVGVPGSVSPAHVRAMHDVLTRLNQVVNQTSDNLIQEGTQHVHTAEALVTTREHDHVKIGQYKIVVRTDQTRVAGKQYYDVINSQTGDLIAHELTLYEAAHGLVRMLNKGQFVNSKCVRELLEAEAAYTSHRIDAIRYHRLINKNATLMESYKLDLYQARKAASLDRAAQAKVKIKKIYNSL